MTGAVASRWPLVVRSLAMFLLAVVAANALVAGPLLVAGPDGRYVGLPPEDLEGSPFPDYAVPGVLLTGLGALHAAALVLQLRRHPQAWAWTGAASLALVVWIAVQTLIIEPSFLQPVLLAVGVANGLLALLQCRLATREGGER